MILHYCHFYTRGVFRSLRGARFNGKKKKKNSCWSQFRYSFITIEDRHRAVRGDFRAAVTLVKFDRARIRAQMMPGSFVASGRNGRRGNGPWDFASHNRKQRGRTSVRPRGRENPGYSWFDVATSKRVCKAGDGPRSWSLMKNRCALFPERRPLSEGGWARTGGYGTTWCKSSRASVPQPRNRPKWMTPSCR